MSLIYQRTELQVQHLLNRYTGCLAENSKASDKPVIQSIAVCSKSLQHLKGKQARNEGVPCQIKSVNAVYISYGPLPCKKSIRNITRQSTTFIVYNLNGTIKAYTCILVHGLFYW